MTAPVAFDVEAVRKAATEWVLAARLHMAERPLGGPEETRAWKDMDRAKDAFEATLTQFAASVRAQAHPLSRLSETTYEVRHNPNCPKRFEVRLCGKSGTVGCDQRGNIVGHGNTLADAVATALRTAADHSDKEGGR
jgi:hypothetical protein